MCIETLIISSMQQPQVRDLETLITLDTRSNLSFEAIAYDISIQRAESQTLQ
jgi:hypothetical protein